MGVIYNGTWDLQNSTQLYVYKIYSILKIQNITLDTEISWM